MDILLFLLAFPGLALAATAFWARAGRRYQAQMQRVASYPDPSIDEVIDRGFITVYRQTSKAEAEMDEAARSGSLGPEAQRLQQLERRWFYTVGLMIPVGMVAAIALGWLLAPRASAIDIDLLVTLYVGTLTLIGVVCSCGAFTSMRAGRRFVAALYILGIAGLVVGGYIGIVELVGTS